MVSLLRNHNILIDSMLVVELKSRISFLGKINHLLSIYCKIKTNGNQIAINYPPMTFSKNNPTFRSDDSQRDAIFHKNRGS